MYNPPLWTKLVATFTLSIIAIVLYLLNRKSKQRLLCMIAMIACSVGDIFMTNTFKINDMVSTIIGATSFIVGHLFYANMFYVMKKKSKLLNKGFYIGLLLGLIPIIIMDILGFVLVDEPNTLYLICVPFYVLVISIHIACNFSYGFDKKDYKSIILAFAVTLFYVTDIWIFLYMFKLAPKSLQDCVWHFYPLAQLLIIIFSDERIKLPSLIK